MRDKKNIDRLLSVLRMYWQKNPLLTLGQIIMNITASSPSYAARGPYDMPDEFLLSELNKLLDEENKRELELQEIAR